MKNTIFSKSAITTYASCPNVFVALCLLFCIFNISFSNFLPLGSNNGPFISNNAFIETHKLQPVSAQTDYAVRELVGDIDKRGFETGEHFLTQNLAADSIIYLDMAQGRFENAPIPFRYRILYPLIVYKIFDGAQNLSPKVTDTNLAFLTIVYWIANSLCVVGCACFLFAIARHYNVNPQATIAGLFLLCCQISFIRYVPFPYVDIAASLLFCAIFWAVLTERYKTAMLCLVLAALCKETLLLWAPALIAHYIFDKRNIRILVAAAVPIVTYLVMRSCEPEHILFIQHGLDFEHNSFNWRFWNSRTGAGFPDWLKANFAAYLFFPVYLVRFKVLKQHRIAGLCAVAVLVLTAAIFVLTATVTRNASLCFPMFLLLGWLSVTTTNYNSVIEEKHK